MRRVNCPASAVHCSVRAIAALFHVATKCSLSPRINSKRFSVHEIYGISQLMSYIGLIIMSTGRRTVSLPCFVDRNEKFELKLTRRAKAYSSSCLQTVSLSPAVFMKDGPTTVKYRLFARVPLFDALVRRFP